MNYHTNSSTLRTSPKKTFTDGSPSFALNEGVVGEKAEQEGDVGLRGSSVHSHPSFEGSFTLTPRIRNSTSARSILRRATSYVVPLTVHLTSKLS